MRSIIYYRKLLHGISLHRFFLTVGKSTNDIYIYDKPKQMAENSIHKKYSHLNVNVAHSHH